MRDPSCLEEEGAALTAGVFAGLRRLVSPLSPPPGGGAAR